MTISFNGGADPEEVKFNGQDMETVIFNGITVWEKVVGVEYTVTSANSSGSIGWNIIGFPYGSISPSPIDSFGLIIARSNGIELQIGFSSNQTFPVGIRFDGVIYNLNPFVFEPLFSSYESVNPSASMQPLFNSLAIVGNNTTFELIYP